MKKILIFAGLIVFAMAAASFAVDNTKPETHNSLWTMKHGDAANANIEDCLTCHEERLECIACHEDVKPRNHTLTWTNKVHGMESRLNRMDCSTCHQQDFCVECHETAVPLSHSRAGFADGVGSTASWHCQTGCYLTTGAPWQSAAQKNCITCHQTRPMLDSGGVHVP